jgi:hypothetical protein
VYLQTPAPSPCSGSSDHGRSKFIGRALRGTAGIFTGLTDEVGNGRPNREADVVTVKRAFGALGRYQEPEDRASGIIDRPLDTAIRGFQRDKGLRVDGFMRPAGPTERSLQDDLRGTLHRTARTGAGFEPDRLRWPERNTLGSLSLLEPGPGREGKPTTIAIADAGEPEPPRLKPFLDKAERNLRRTAEGWRKEGMLDAARHLEHFLDGSGEPITYNRDQARSFSPVRNAEEDAQSQLQRRILQQASTLKDGEGREIAEEVTGSHSNFQHGLGLLRGLLGDRDRFDDNVAVGRTPIKSIFKGRSRRNGGRISVEGVVDYDWNDQYNFHSGQPGADAALSIQKYRGARSFGFGAKWQQRVDGAIQRQEERLRPDLSFSDVD